MFDAGDETWSSSRFDDLTDWLKVHVKETSFATYVYCSVYLRSAPQS